MSKPKYLAWIKTNGMVWPQLWYYDQIDSPSGQRKYGRVGEDERLVAFQKLDPSNNDLSMQEIVDLFPPEKCQYHVKFVITGETDQDRS